MCWKIGEQEWTSVFRSNSVFDEEHLPQHWYKRRARMIKHNGQSNCSRHAQTWEHYILGCASMRGLTEEGKVSATNAVRYLQKPLGDDFPSRITGEPHMLLQYLPWPAPWSLLWLVRFVDALRALEAAPNFGTLTKRLRKRSQSWEAASVVAMARKFSRGFELYFEPQVAVTGFDGRNRSKLPDFKITDLETKEEVYVEVSELLQSDELRRVRKLCSFIPDLLLKHLGPTELVMYARMSKSFDESCVDNAIRVIKELIVEVTKTGRFRSLINRNIEVGIAPRLQVGPLDQWARARGIAPGIAGPPIHSNGISRLRKKIWKKLDQLPKDKPGILAISVTGSSLFLSNELSAIISSTEQSVSGHSNVLCVVVSHSYLMGDETEESELSIGPHRLINRATGTVLKEQTLIVFNPKYTSPLSTETRAKIARALQVDNCVWAKS